MIRRRHSTAILLLGLFAAGGPAALAQDFPNRPVRLVVGNPPGGTADLIARQMSVHFTALWKQSTVVDNRPGAAGMVGTDLVAKATPDGYTLLVSAPGPVTTHTILVDKLPYDPLKDLAPITMLAVSPSVLMVKSALPVQSVAELIALAKSQPGKLNYASSGNGNPSHLHGALLASLAGIDIVHVPFKGGGPAINDLVGGHIEIMFNAVPAMLPYITANRVKALAVTSPRRLPSLPNVPTMTESGLAQIGSTVWYGAFAPAGVSAPMQKRLHADFVHVLRLPDMKAFFEKGGSDAVGDSPEQFGKFLRTEIEVARKLLKTSGARRG